MSMFVGAVLVLFEKRWEHEVEGENLVHLTVNVDLTRAMRDISETIGAVLGATDGFDARRNEVAEAMRHLAASAAIRLEVDHVTQGPWRDV